MATTTQMVFRAPPDLKKKIEKRLAELRKKNLMANLSDAIRDLIERGATRR